MTRYDDPLVKCDNSLIRYDDHRTYRAALNSQPSRAMFDVVLDLRNRSVPETISRLKTILTTTSEQAAFASFAAYITALRTDENAVSDEVGKIATTVGTFPQTYSSAAHQPPLRPESLGPPRRVNGCLDSKFKILPD